MKNITRKISVFGATGAAATALIVGGMIAPAQASTLDDAQGSNATSATSSIDGALYRALSGNANGNGASTGPLLNGPVLNGPVVDRSLTSDINDVASGNAIASGNDVPVASGNDTSVSAPVTAPVTAPVDAPVDAAVDAPVGSANDTDLGGVSGDIGAGVTDVVDGALGNLDLGAVLGD
ncbi:hypothetical protein E3T54_01795 [Cryobacterium sp. Sr8]|uniref:hypothetical protein n=1 Tax=Cryobacterium sp. Sr8 TaxID=1259203 RepID=UPI00106D0D1E|nr:hypothetical protein [Cryobacterium sp. Sr8]TFD81561.1 hypothetical protein E3T54_01795 [Cryobacterium sp. Sr8]